MHSKMRNCKHYEEALWEAVETGNISASLAAHLEGCERCRQSLRALGSAFKGFEALHEVGTGTPDPRGAVHTRLLEPPPGKRWLVPSLATACCLLFAMLVLLCRMGPHSPSKAPVVAGNHIAVPATTSKAPELSRAPEPPVAPVAAEPRRSPAKRQMAFHQRPTRARASLRYATAPRRKSAAAQVASRRPKPAIVAEVPEIVTREAEVQYRIEVVPVVTRHEALPSDPGRPSYPVYTLTKQLQVVREPDTAM